MKNLFKITCMFCLIAAMQCIGAAERSVSGVAYAHIDSIEWFVRPQVDSAVVAVIPVSSIAFPLQIQSESGGYFAVRIGNKNGWVKKYLLTVSDQTATVVSGRGDRPKTTMGTTGIEDGSNPETNGNKAAVDGASNQISKEVSKALNLPK